MKKDSKIYVAGHTGLVGSAILRSLQNKGYTNLIFKTLKDLDLRSQAAVNRFFEMEKPEYVIIAAAKVGGILANNTYRGEFIYDNIMIQSNIIDASFKNKVKKLLFLGSTCIYPRDASQPIKEDYLLTAPLEYTNEPYAIAKIAGIKMCESYNIQYGTNFISVMPTNLYGPGDNFNLETSHVLPAVLRKMHLAKCLEKGDWVSINKDLNRRPIKGVNGNSSQEEILKILGSFGIQTESGTVPPVASRPLPAEASAKVGQSPAIKLSLWGSGTPLREFLYVDDMADALTFLMERVDFETILSIMGNPKEVRNTHINIGTGSDLSILNLSGMVKDIVGFRGTIFFDTSKPDGTPKKLIDVSLLDSLGWKYNTELIDGIKKLYDWYLDDLDKV